MSLQRAENALAVDDSKRQIARLRFLRAALRLANSGYTYGNPFDRLHTEAYPKWLAAVTPPPLPPSGSGVRRMRYLGYDDRLRQQSQQKAILESWAHDCLLVEGYKDGRLIAASWIVEEAQQCCESWRQKDREVERGPLPANIASPPVPLKPPPGIWNALSISLDDPVGREGESWEEFNKRARKAFNRHLARMRRTWGQPAQPPKLPKPQKEKPVNLDHFEWLVLYQCCGWHLKEIRAEYPHVGTDIAIYVGLQAKAKLTGLYLLPRKLKAELWKPPQFPMLPPLAFLNDSATQ